MNKIVLILVGSLLFLLRASAGEITYVDAVEGADGNTYATGRWLADTSWINPDTSSKADFNSWKKRAGGNSSFFQARHNRDAMPELTTEITGLADGDYNVWVFFWDSAGSKNHWTISAGLRSGDLTTYSHDGAGDTDSPVAASTLTFSVTPLMFQEDKTLYGVNLGLVTVSGGSTINVYIDNLVGGDSSERTWYDGVGFEPVSVAKPITLGFVDWTDVFGAGEEI